MVDRIPVTIINVGLQESSTVVRFELGRPESEFHIFVEEVVPFLPQAGKLDHIASIALEQLEGHLGQVLADLDRIKDNK